LNALASDDENVNPILGYLDRFQRDYDNREFDAGKALDQNVNISIMRDFNKLPFMVLSRIYSSIRSSDRNPIDIDKLTTQYGDASEIALNKMGGGEAYNNLMELLTSISTNTPDSKDKWVDNSTKENIKRTKELIDAGTVPAGDIFELQATDASQEQQIVNAQNTLLISKLGLAQTLLLKDYANFDIAVEAMDIPATQILFQTPEAIAIKARDVVKDIKIAATNYEEAQKSVSLVKSDYLPRISGFVGYNTRWSQSIPIGFVDQLSLFDGTNVGVQLSVPILNGFANLFCFAILRRFFFELF
jgi:hypothetical protein